MAQWRRLADYFIVIGYQQDKDGETGGGRVIQRFPEKDWPDVPFTHGIELFCQPGGWELTERRQEPTYFVSVLTDIDAERRYCACLTFYEPYDDLRGEAGEIERDDDMVHHSVMFAPKSIVLISQLDYFDTFKNCLGVIYTVYVEGNYSCDIEELVGNILGCIMVPPAGGPQVRFTIGAGDKQVLQPPTNIMIPVTRKTTAILFHELGIHNVILLVSAALTDHKILFTSRSYSRLTITSTALSALLYPLKYSYVYIPVLPAGLVEVLSTPTPFIAGVHSSVSSQVQDLLDVIIVDCDSGSVVIPECVHIPSVPEPMSQRLLDSLSLVLNPDLMLADFAFPKDVSKTSDLERLDKEIRAVFIRFFAELFSGYRACLQIVRIHSPPVIQFHNAKFLGMRNLVECDFSKKVLESMCFASFVQSRGAPFRVCDVFDEVFASLSTAFHEEQVDPSLVLTHIKDIANTLYLNENPSSSAQPFVEKIPKPTDGAYSRIHLPKFPIIDWLHVQEIIDKRQSKRDGYQKHTTHLKMPSPRIVPVGRVHNNQCGYYANQTRRLEVLHNCVRFIFENKISDARKIYPAVVRALKNKASRHALTADLKSHAASNKCNLDHQQFLLVVKLFNALLQNESPLDENGIAAQLLPLADTFCRRLSPGVIQFAYTCIQEHAVWANQQFWEATFYEEVQKQIRSLYQSIYRDQNLQPINRQVDIIRSQSNSSNLSPSTSSQGGSLTTEDVSCLEIAAEELRKAKYEKEEELKSLSIQEEGIVYSQALHFCNRMVYLKVPLDTSRGMPYMSHGDGSASSYYTQSIAGSGSLDGESGFDEAEVSEVGLGVTKIINKFIEKVGRESGVSDAHMKSLTQNVPTLVTMHVETIDNVCRESKRLPPILKPKITEPCLLPGETMIQDGLRAYLLFDGREEYQATEPGPQYIPAEGAIFLTTYRVVFKGTPCDQYACELNVIRSTPISAINKEKKMRSEYFQPLDIYLQHIILIRSHTFQLMKVGFDEEVGEESVEHFRKALAKGRSPVSVLDTFAFSGASVIPVTVDQKRKEKYHTLRDLGKTLKKTVRKTAGLKPNKPSDRKTRYMLSGRGSMKGLPPSLAEEFEGRPDSMFGDEDNWSMLSQDDVHVGLQTDPKTQERLSELLCYRDFVRLNLIGSMKNIGQRVRSENFFTSNLNSSYKMCHSYPGLLLFPNNISDESIMRFGRSHRQNRFPVITWRHPRTKALLLRASAFHSRSVMGKLKASQGSTSNRESTGSLSTSYEMEKYLMVLSSLTPAGNSNKRTSSDASGMSTLSTTLTPSSSYETSRLSPARSGTGVLGGMFDKRSSRLLNEGTSASHNKGMSTHFTMAHTSSGLTFSAKSPRDRRNSVTSFTIGGGGRTEFSNAPTRTNATIDTRYHQAEQELSQASLYIFCEKNQSKGMKTEHLSKCEFVSVDFRDVTSVKLSYKKLMRACFPAAVSNLPEHSFNKLVAESGWLVQIQSILQYAGACVDLLDAQGASVILALEDGWDITAQITSIAEMLLDPYYRTFEGFHTLIEKEWLSFGHRFSYRSCQMMKNQSTAFAPMFLQFLDVVHQIHLQFPMSFEFNQFYLKFLAYHHLSNRFRTFMLDSEYERLEAGWLLDDRPRIGMAAADFTANMGNSIWDYIDLQRVKSSIFHNFYYNNEETQDMVLRPHSNMANLLVWDYYLEESLSHGPSYDLELARKETQQQASEMTDDSTESGRITINNCYKNVTLHMPNAFTSHLQEIAAIEKESNQFPSKWSDVVNRLQEPLRDSFRRQYSLSTRYCRSHGRHVHKRSTIEFLVKGKMIPQATKMFSRPHSFENHHYNAPQTCDYCSRILWGFMKTELKCAGCNYMCHEKCKPLVPNTCSNERTRNEANSNGSSGGVELQTASQPLQSPSDEEKTIVESSETKSDNKSKTYEGYLHKRGAMLKGWKCRWFVLDFLKHQLRYYDDKDDTHCKGFIDLAEVVHVASTKSAAGAPKKVEDSAFFEMRTVKRQYAFFADPPEEAHKWVEIIQNRISS
ncbi:myotubularin-related protein 13-like [Watersipora subatra]|uniref:myotubularin-related protein 13-like n=1 Tax=Watersipora subatra TaxID=2589382 RepID=UPI00355BFD9D